MFSCIYHNILKAKHFVSIVIATRVKRIDWSVFGPFRASLSDLLLPAQLGTNLGLLPHTVLYTPQIAKNREDLKPHRYIFRRYFGGH